MLSQSFFRKKDPYLLEHFFAAVNDLIGHADAFVAEGLGLDAVQCIVIDVKQASSVLAGRNPSQ